jgi:hypothetical protein
MPTIPTTRLDAVNQILSAIGLAPIAHLVDEADTMSVAAEQQLDDADREVQGAGWWFNTFERTFALTADGEVLIPGNILYLDAIDKGARYASRNGRLFNLVDGTYTFTADVTVRVTEMLPFVELPEAARTLIVAKAARKYAARHLSDPGTTREMKADEAEAFVSLRKAHVRAGNHSIWGPSIGAAMRRGGPLVS